MTSRVTIEEMVPIHAKIAAVTFVNSAAKYWNMWLTSETGADVGSCSRYDWVVGGPECWPPQADEDGKLDPTNCANRCRWFCELSILAEVMLPCTWFSALPRGPSRGFDHFSMWDETLNPSGLSLPSGCTDSHGVSSGRILCEQFSVHPNHPKICTI